MSTESSLAILAERKIAAAMAEGVFEGLSGRGAPLRWEDDSAVPDEWRLAHHLLRSNGLAPAWIEMGLEIRNDLARARRLLAEVVRADGRPRRAEAEFDRLARDLNRRIADFNLRAPSPRWHLPLIHAAGAPGELGAPSRMTDVPD